MVGLGGMMRSMRNKVVHAAQTATREAKESVQEMVGDVAQEVIQRKKPAKTRRKYGGISPPVSHKRKPTRVASQSRSRPSKRRRTTLHDVFDATS